MQEASKGVLGIGSKNAVVRITVKNENLSEKGLRSKKALENILDFLVPTYSVDMRESAERIKLEIRKTNDKGLLIGRHGDMIRSMEYIVGKIASRI